jgi:hypothetical protein
MQSVPTYGILYHLFAVSAASQKRHSFFHQVSTSITSVVQQNPRLKAVLLSSGDYCFN